MAKGRSGRKAPFEDRRMWRRLLARLHPDAGGDPELFLFACAVRDGTHGQMFAGNKRGQEPFMGAWQTTMDAWASRNRSSLRKPRTPRR